MDIELKIKSWNDVSIDKYYQILDIFKDDSKAEFDKYMSLLALLCDVDEDVVYSLDIIKAQAMFSAISWINDFSFLKKKGGMGEMGGSLMQIMGGFTLLRLTSMMGMAGVSLTKEELLKLNKKLNRIKKPKASKK